MTALNIVAVGAGAIGKRHIALVHANCASGLSALVDPSPAAVQTAAAAGVPRFADLAALFAAQRPDGVILAIPSASLGLR